MGEIVYNKNGIPFDIDAIATDLNGKMDVDGVNSTCSVCVESWHEGTEWYRVYSDGWCEQGGPFANDESITFFKQYSSIPNIACTPTTTASTITNQGLCVSQLSTSGFHINTGSSWSGCWEAKGYIR